MTTTTITDPAKYASYNRGPLTTTYQPPSSCLSTFTLNNDNGATSLYCGHAGSLYYDSSCYPSGSASTESNWGQYYYSPGQCPQGWAPATTFTSYFPAYGGSTTILLFSLGSSTNAALCCPSGWTSWGGIGHQCGTSADPGQKIHFFSTTLYNNEVGLAKPSTTTIKSGGEFIWGDGIPIWWQSTDLPAFTAPPQTTTSPVQTTTNTSSLPSATSSNPKPSVPKSSGFSTGAKVAIGVTIPVVALLLLLAVFFYFRRMAQRKVQYKAVELGADSQPKVAELQAEEGEPLKVLPTRRTISELQTVEGNRLKESSTDAVSEPDGHKSQAQTLRYYEFPEH